MSRTLLLAVIAAASLGAHAGPVEPTTISGGKFAPDTKWYTMQITARGYYLTNDEVNGAMPLSQTSAMPSAADMWCFVGSDATGYSVYNRAEGTAKSLAAPSNPVGTDQGGSAYATLKAPGQSDQCYLWNFSASTNIPNSFYMFEVGNSSYKLNNRNNRLAFWTAGADAGSSIVFTEIESALEVNADGSVTVGSDPAITLKGSKPATLNPDGTITLGNCNYFFTAPDGKTVKSCSIIYADGSEKTFNSRGENADQLPIAGPATVAEIYTHVIDTPVAAESGYAVFRYDGTPDFNVVYRIPSIVTVQAGEYKGRVVAINDYRLCGGDIGAGRIDLHISYSDDNGKTWSVPDDMRNAQGTPVARGTGAPTPEGKKQSEANLDCGYGDAASVSDRETGELLVVACCGRVTIFNSQRNDPQPSARWWSNDGGLTWTEPDYGQWEQIYSLFDNNCPDGAIDGQFVGSGRMVQSSRIKVGSHYRVYCVISGRTASTGNFANWVLYSDDFGHNWNILGDPMNPAVASSADEPKCEELPDGSILLAARGNGGGRNFNIFHYSDPAKGEGRWGAPINTNLGTGHGVSACNGEIIIIPVRNTASGNRAYMAIQSFPNSTTREKVSLAWKILETGADFDEPADFATWNGFYQLTSKPSAYSTLTLQADNSLGILFEERTFNQYDYCEIYRNLTIEELTDGAWEYFPDADGSVAARLTAESVTSRADNIAGQPGDVVGNLSDEGKALVKAAADAYAANASDNNFHAFNAATDDPTLRLMPAHGGIYSFRNAHGGLSGYPTTDRWLAFDSANPQLVTAQAESTNTRFALIRPSGSDNFALYNIESQSFVKNAPNAFEQNIATTNLADEAGEYRFEVNPGIVSIVSVNAGKPQYPAIHMNSTCKPVVWTIGAAASKWVMTLLDTADNLPELSSINEISASCNEAAPTRYFDLQGRPVATPRRGSVLITDTRRKLIIR